MIFFWFLFGFSFLFPLLSYMYAIIIISQTEWNIHFADVHDSAELTSGEISWKNFDGKQREWKIEPDVYFALSVCTVCICKCVCVCRWIVILSLFSCWNSNVARLLSERTQQRKQRKMPHSKPLTNKMNKKKPKRLLFYALFLFLKSKYIWWNIFFFGWQMIIIRRNKLEEKKRITFNRMMTTRPNFVRECTLL